jgi:hypothetical protein
MYAISADELNFVLPQIYEPSSDPAGKFLGRVLLLLHRHYSDLLFEYVECKYNASVTGYGTNLFFTVKIFPYALNIPVLFQRFYLRPNFRLYRAPFPIESDGTWRARPSSADWIQRMVGADGLTCHWWSHRSLHLLLGPIRRVIFKARAREDTTRSTLGCHAEVRRGSLVVV